jgi:hypothetical protein
VEAGDLISRLRLDTTGFQKELTSAQKEFASAFGTMATGAKQSSEKAAKSTEASAKRQKKAAQDVGRSWWASFGRVALGFTVAYRAMNAFERGVQELTQTISGAIRESGELAAVQAKLAFWYKMHSQEAVSYADAFDRAAVNVNALAKASLTSVSSLEELSTGIDEVAQSIGAVAPAMIPALADVVDYTVMVAQTTGSTIRQVRQELQALMEGQMRTTNILLRSMKNLGVLTEEDIKNLKAMTNRAQIFEKVLLAISEHWADLKEKLLATDVNVAFKYWEKSIRLSMTYAVKAASEIEGIGNIFAQEFKRRADEAAKSIGSMNLQMLKNIVLTRKLRDALSWGLDAFEKMISVVNTGAVIIDNLSEELKTTLKIILAYLGVSAVTKVLAVFGNTLMWIVNYPIKLIKVGMTSMYAKLFAIPIATAAVGIALETLFQMIRDRWPVVVDEFINNLGVLSRTAVKVFSFVGGLIEDAFNYWWDLAKPVAERGAKLGEEFGTLFYKNLQKHMGQLEKILGPIATEIRNRFEGLLVPEVPFDYEPYYILGKGAGEGLASGFKQGVDEDLVKYVEKTLTKLGIKFKALQDTMRDIGAGFLKDPNALKRHLEILERMAELEEKGVSPTLINDIMYMERLIDDSEEALDLWKEWTIALETPEEKLARTIQKIDEFAASLGFTAKQIEKLKKLAREDLTLIGEAYKNMLSGIQDVFADTFEDIFSGQLESFEDFTESMKSMFIRVLAEMAAKAASEKLFESLGPSAGMGVASAGVFGLSILTHMLSKRSDKEAEERVRKLEEAWRDVNEQIENLLSPLEGVAQEFANVNKQFDDWISSLWDAGASLRQIMELEEKREEVLAATRKRLADEFIFSMEDAIAKFTMSDIEFELHGLETWYEERIEDARLLGNEAVNLLREAYELSKKELILEQQRALTGTSEEIQESIETLGMTPMELQIHQLEKQREQWEDELQAIVDAMAAINADLADKGSEIVNLQNSYNTAIAELATAEGDFAASYQQSMERFIESQSHLTKEQAEKLWKESYDINVRYMEQYGTPNWNTEPWKSWFLGVYNLQQVYEETANQTLPLINTIPGEIEVINSEIEAQLAALAALEEELGLVGGELQEAYLAQLSALRTEFIGGIEEIIRSHTLSDYEQQMYALNEWYEEAVTNAEALGVSLDLINEAYELQKDAIEEAALALDDWMSALKSLQNLLLELTTGLQSPADALERLAVVEAQLASYGVPTTPEEVAEMQDLLTRYLDIAQEAYQRPSMEYKDIYDYVINALRGLETIAATNAALPSAQGGGLFSGPDTGYPVILHGTELVTPQNSAGEVGTATYYLNFTINESEYPRETAKEVRREIESFMRSSRGGKIIQARSQGRV